MGLNFKLCKGYHFARFFNDILSISLRAKTSSTRLILPGWEKFAKMKLQRPIPIVCSRFERSQWKKTDRKKSITYLLNIYHVLVDRSFNGKLRSDKSFRNYVNVMRVHAPYRIVWWIVIFWLLAPLSGTLIIFSAISFYSLSRIPLKKKPNAANRNIIFCHLFIRYLPVNYKISLCIFLHSIRRRCTFYHTKI